MAQPAYPLDLPEEQDGERWPAQGEWTYEDYARLPDDGRRYEVIRGYLYVSPAPTYEHQYAVVQLSRLLGMGAARPPRKSAQFPFLASSAFGGAIPTIFANHWWRSRVAWSFNWWPASYQRVVLGWLPASW